MVTSANPVRGPAQPELGPSLPEGVRVRILRTAHGDRRAAAELASALTERQLTGVDPLPAQPPVLLRAYRQEVRALPDTTRRLLLLAAADQYPVDTHAFLRAVTATRLDTRPLVTAEVAGVAHATAGGIVFRDPWTRIAAYETASVTDRRAVHLLLARVLRGEGESPRRSWHRGAAALGPSRRLAAELRAAAHTARTAGDHALACALVDGGRPPEPPHPPAGPRRDRPAAPPPAGGGGRQG
ncbi:LuxR family transcriptional regulator, partial [Streptomyces mirabilis]